MGKEMIILALGTTDFLISNFVRYIVYRSNHKIVSIDNFNPIEKMKNIYINKKHIIQVGNYKDLDFLSKVMIVYKPDVVVCGDESFDEDFDFSKFNIPVYIIKRNQKSLNTNEIILPNRFGMRQGLSYNFGSNLAQIQYNILNKNTVKVYSKPISWVYAEDVASFILYLLELKKEGKFYMTPLGTKSELEIATKISSLYQIKADIIEENKQNIIDDYVYTTQESEWEPDEKNLDKVLENTINWFDKNRWAFNIP